MSRYIDADKIIYFKQRQNIEGKIIEAHLVHKEMIDLVPTANVEPKMGEWRGEHKMPDMPRYEWYRCSECSFLSQSVVNYCPNCGAKMDKE